MNIRDARYTAPSSPVSYTLLCYSCWLAIKDEYGNHDGLIWAFIGPVYIVILINFGIMVAVMRVVVRSAVSVVPREKRNLQTVK